MDYYGKRKIWYAISLILILISLGSLLIQGLNKGIDFQSGTLIDLQFTDESITTEQLRDSLKAALDLDTSKITQDGGGSFIIKSVELSQEQQTVLLENLTENIGKYDLKRVESVGPIIGKELTKNGILALVVASILMIIYISFRFQFKFAIAAILCLLHDVFIMLGFFSLMQFEIESSFIAAILTIVGYSINNTIVIFDRIRENLKGVRRSVHNNILNKSISETMTRTINTTLTVLVVLLSMIFLGGETTRVFAIALLIGNIAGFYSSIFIAGNLWLDFDRKFK